MAALVLFSLILQLCLFACVCLNQSACLAAASRQSKMDLAVYDQARNMAERNVYARRCPSESEVFMDSLEVEIEGKTVVFTDQETFIEAGYDLNDETVTARIYYDETGIVDLKYE